MRKVRHIFNNDVAMKSASRKSSENLECNNFPKKVLEEMSGCEIDDREEGQKNSLHFNN